MHILTRLKPFLISFAKYLLAGGMGFIVDYTTLFLLYSYLSVNYLFAAGAAFGAGIVFVYVCSNRWVFNKRQMQHKQWLEFLIFTIIGIIGLLLTIFFMWLFVNLCGMHPLIAKPVTIAPVFMWNYSARKIILY